MAKQPAEKAKAKAKPRKAVPKKKEKKNKTIELFVKPGTELHVLEIEDKTDNITTALGITQERAKELEEKVKVALKASDNVVQVIVPLSKECKHANELYFVSMIMTDIVVKLRNPFHAMVVSIGRTPEPGKEGG